MPVAGKKNKLFQIKKMGGNKSDRLRDAVLIIMVVTILAGCNQEETDNSTTNTTGIVTTTTAIEDGYNPQVVLDEIARHKLQIEGDPTIVKITLPERLTDANWGLKALVCENGGYNLYAYAGETIYITSCNITETCKGEPLQVCVLTEADICICAYKTVRENSEMVPGIFPIDETCL